jgi:hypothetical protein
MKWVCGHFAILVVPALASYIISTFPPTSACHPPNVMASALVFVACSLIAFYSIRKAMRKSELLAWPSLVRPPCPAIFGMRPPSDDPLQSMLDTDLAWIGLALGAMVRARHDLGFLVYPNDLVDSCRLDIRSACLLAAL